LFAAGSAHNPGARLRGALRSLFLLRFFVAPFASDTRAAGQKPVSGAIVRNGMMLLISTAGLTTPVPICLDRRKIATGRDLSARVLLVAREQAWTQMDAGRTNRAALSPAEQLGKGWRFFVTYAKVQTGPHLRHVLQTRA